MTTAVFVSTNSGTGTLGTLIPGFAWYDTGSGNRIAVYNLTDVQLGGLRSALPGTAGVRLYRFRSGDQESTIQAMFTAWKASPWTGIKCDVQDPAEYSNQSSLVFRDTTFLFTSLTAALRIRKCAGVTIDNCSFVGPRDDSGAATAGAGGLIYDLNISECTGQIFITNCDFAIGSRGAIGIVQPSNLADQIYLKNLSGHQTGACYQLQSVSIGPGNPGNTEFGCSKYGLTFTDNGQSAYKGYQNMQMTPGPANESRVIALPSSGYTVTISMTPYVANNLDPSGGWGGRDWWIYDSSGVLRYCTASVNGNNVTLTATTAFTGGSGVFGMWCLANFVQSNLHIEDCKFSGHPGTGGGGSGISIYGINGATWINPKGYDNADYQNGAEGCRNVTVYNVGGTKRSGGSDDLFSFVFGGVNNRIVGAGGQVGMGSLGYLIDNQTVDYGGSVSQAINNSATLGGDENVMFRFNCYHGCLANGQAVTYPLTYLNPGEVTPETTT